MRLAYLDCFAGISGDMFLGALLDAGLPPEVLHQATSGLNLGASLQIERVDRSGITSTKVHVLEHGHLAEAHAHTEAHSHTHEHTLGHAEAHAEAHAHQHSVEEQLHHEDDHQHHPKTQHLHKTGQPHTHEPAEAHAHAESHAHAEAHTHEPHAHEPHPHTHGRSLTDIRQLIRASNLAEPVKDFALRTFHLLGVSEAKIHNVPVDDIHFHEVGSVDAIVDIVCASAGIHHLNQQAIRETAEPLHWHASPLNVGGGTVLCAHGNFPVPAPATTDLLRGLPTYSAHIQKELVTPTGAALIRALDPTFGPQPPMRVEHIGYGAGTRNPSGFPNVLRLSLGHAAETPNRSTTTESSFAHPLPATFGEGTRSHSPHADTVTVLETALDDLSPQILAHVTEQALALGALDVMTTAVGMKKGRPGTLLTLLTDEQHSPALERLLLRETSTLGIRIHQQRRICLARRHLTVSTTFGGIRIKIGSFDAETLNAQPEFEDCRAAALAHNVPVKEVLQAAIAAYINHKPPAQQAAASS